jgi:DNA primase
MRAKYSREQIEEVIRGARIQDIVGDYLKLKPSGRRLVAVCPFHGDKDPSLSVNPEKGLWYCFGCGEGGNVFKFVEMIEKVDFGEALEIVARRAGIILKSQQPTKESSERERLTEMVRIAAQFYHEQLINSDQGRPAMMYLKDRKVTLETIKLFKLGYAPWGKITILYYLERQGFSKDEIVKSGLVLKKIDTGEYLDHMRNRVTIPICDAQGRFIAMGGRAIDDTGGPKYLNTPETSIFSKGRTLFGLNLAKKAISKEDRAIVVEGYMDLIMLQQEGVHNVVASLGTSLSLEQARLLRKFCSTCILAYDSDQAGRLASVRGVDIFEDAGIHPRVLVLPPGEDPDSMVRRASSGDFLAMAEEALDLVEFKMKILRESFDPGKPESRMEFVREVVPLIQEIRDPFRKDSYFHRLSDETGVDVGLLRIMKKEGEKIAHPVGSARKMISAQSTEEILLQQILHYPRALPRVKEMLSLAELTAPPIRAIFESLYAMEGKSAFTVEDFLPYLSDEGIMKRITELIMGGDVPPFSEEFIIKLIQKIKDEKLKIRFRELEKEVQRLLSQNNIDHSDERYLEYQRLYQYFKGSK